VVLVPTTVLGELHAGFAVGGRRAENERALEDFLAEPFVAVVPVTADVARRYGEVHAALRRAGTPIPINDVWIAAVALDAGATVLTFDTDFERVPGLSVRRLG
jgi:tRNA(fMet)-specific endonuclease VapC